RGGDGAAGPGADRATRALPGRAGARSPGLHRAPRAPPRGLAARRHLDRALRAVLLPAPAAHEGRQRGPRRAVPPGALSAAVPAHRGVLAVRAAPRVGRPPPPATS